jgi:hypothetical protein
LFRGRAGRNELDGIDWSIEATVFAPASLPTPDDPGFVPTDLPLLPSVVLGSVSLHVEIVRSDRSDQPGGHDQAVKLSPDEPANFIATPPELACNR